jgi:hypothetical protein
MVLERVLWYFILNVFSLSNISRTQIILSRCHSNTNSPQGGRGNLKIDIVPRLSTSG